MNDAPSGDEPATPTTTKGPPSSSVSALYVPLKPHTHHRTRSDFTTCLALSRQQQIPAATASDSPRHTTGECRPESSSHDARTLFQRGWANKALGCLDQAAADFEAARRLEPLHPHLSVDYRNIFDTELVVVDDIEPLTQSPALFHSW